MVKASDFDRKMLFLATQLANDSDMKMLLLSVLEELLTTLNVQRSPDYDAEILTLLRCIIRLVVKLINEPAANRLACIGSRRIDRLTSGVYVSQGSPCSHSYPTLSHR